MPTTSRLSIIGHRMKQTEANLSLRYVTLRYVPVAGNPTIIMTSLSLAVVPITSSGAAFSPSGKRCGVGLSTTGADDGGADVPLVVPAILDDDIELRLWIGSECAVDAGAPGMLGDNVMIIDYCIVVCC